MRIYLMLTIGLLSRLLPHVPNATCILFCSLMLGAWLSPLKGIVLALSMWFLSDIFVGILHKQSLLGTWMLFSYSAAIGIVLLGHALPKNTSFKFNLFLFPSSLLFWLWTNLGVWLFSAIYPLSINGLIECYLMALPFLKNQLFGDLVTCLVVLVFSTLLKERSSFLKSKSYWMG